MQDRFKFRYVLNNEVCEVLAFDISDGIEHKCLFLQLKDGTRKIINDYDWSKFNQCTGLKDINGKLIYEGDIVKTTLASEDISKQEIVVFVVCWSNKKGVFNGKIVNQNNTKFFFIKEDYLYYLLGNEEDKTEVIGNIYENPELLEDSK